MLLDDTNYSTNPSYGGTLEGGVAQWLERGALSLSLAAQFLEVEKHSLAVGKMNLLLDVQRQMTATTYLAVLHT